MLRRVAAVRRGSFITDERVRRFGLALLMLEVTLFLLGVAGTHGWIVPVGPIATDFVSFYGAGSLANEGLPALAYDRAAHYASEQQATEPGIAYNYFFYPPVFLLLCSLLARLPYLTAFILFQAGCLVSCLAVARWIVGPARLSTLLAFPAIFWSIGTGQNALLTGALLGAATLLVDRRPVLSGLLMGATCYKPHLGLLVPVALLAGGHWRAFAAAAATVAGLIAASIVAFGFETWVAFGTLRAGVGSVYGTAETYVDLPGITSPFGLALALGSAPAVAGGVQLAVTAGVVVAVGWVWARRTGLAVRSAVLLAGIPVAVPIVMFYDLMLTGLSLAWLVRDGRDHGFPPWSLTTLAVLFLLPLWSGNTGFNSQIGIPPAAAALGFALAMRHAIRSPARSEPNSFHAADAATASM